jgi:hypothetical protein
LPQRRNPNGFVGEILRRGLAVVGDDVFAVDASAQPGVRVCLGAPRTRDELAQGLQVLAESFASPNRAASIV